MVFETLWESAQRKELILVEGGLCHWHLCRDGQVTLREIIVLPERQAQGVGTAMLEKLKGIENAKWVFSKCPADLTANLWYQSKGFGLVGVETRRSGRKVNLWRLEL